MFFTRIVELEDVALPPEPLNSKAREAPQFGRPSFNVQLPPEWTGKQKRKRYMDNEASRGSAKRRRAEPSNARKGSHEGEDDGVESDDEDIDGLVRVTVVSRRKRIKVFQAPSADESRPHALILGFGPTQPTRGTSPGVKHMSQHATLGTTALAPQIEHPRDESPFWYSVRPLDYRQTSPGLEDDGDDKDDEEEVIGLTAGISGSEKEMVEAHSISPDAKTIPFPSHDADAETNPVKLDGPLRFRSAEEYKAHVK
jgi:hypothetical protein